MPRDSNGVYSLPNGYLAVTGETIEASQHNPPLEDLASAITGSLPRNGAAPMTGNLNMGNKRVIAVANPESASDAVPKSYADGLLTNVGTITGASISNYRTGVGDGNSFRIQVYDVDGTAYLNALSVVAGNDPTMNLHANFTIGSSYIYRGGGTDVALVDGGTGSSLTSPEADRLMFWDQSATSVTWLAPGNTSTKIDGTTLKTGAEIASFSAHKNGTNQTISNNTDVKVTFGTEAFDVGSAFASSTWTPPAGKVMLTGQVTATTGNDNRPMTVHIFKNGSAYRTFAHTSRSSNSKFYMPFSFIDEANGTDTYEVYLNISDTGSPVVSGATADTFLAGTII